jgi:cytochrome c551/c552
VRKFLKWGAVILIVLFVLIQLKRPAKTNPPVDEQQTIFARTQMTPAVSTILNRSCADCHSNKTVWPWYSNVAPVSWFVIGHVDHARQAMNLSEWGKMEKDRQDRKLRQMCDEVEDGAMPLSSYTPMHPGSKLSSTDVKTLCEWTSAERSRGNAVGYVIRQARLR